MAVDSCPWFIGIEGVQHSAEVARAMAYAGTGGVDGVIGTSDLRVTALPTPGSSVRVLPGAAAMVNRFSSDSKQSYIGRSGSYTDVAIAPTTSSGARSDMVVATIRDPQQRVYGDWSPAVLNDYDYFRLAVIQGVGPSAVSIPGATYPLVPLARIDIPASTATITESMIKDVRSLTHTRVERQVKVITPGVDLNMHVQGYANYPGGMTVPLKIPTWATRLVIMTYYSGIESTGGPGLDSMAGFRGVLGTIIDNQNTILKCRQQQRITHIHTSQFSIPAAYRGLTVGYATQATHQTGSGALQLDYQSTITYDAQFMEVPE